MVCDVRPLQLELGRVGLLRFTCLGIQPKMPHEDEAKANVDGVQVRCGDAMLMTTRMTRMIS